MLMIVALNDIDLQAADIENAYLTAPCREKIWTRAEPEFGMDEGKVFIVVRALYGLKSSDTKFWAFVEDRFRQYVILIKYCRPQFLDDISYKE